jgi:hypothetical protein
VHPAAVTHKAHAGLRITAHIQSRFQFGPCTVGFETRRRRLPLSLVWLKCGTRH